MSTPPSPGDLTAFIKQTAIRLGFDKVGVIPAEPVSDETAAHLMTWLGLGYHAEMQWMAAHTEKRLNPAALMPNARSIVCVAMNYQPRKSPVPMSGQLKIARYARGSDYHDVLKKRLRQLLAEIRQIAPDVQGRAVTDSAPIMEKPLAVKAGLGWIGKNANLITRDRGSWVFLGELLLDIALDYDRHTEPNHCGRCRRCIDACPTGAIVQDGVIDANRCIAYWTIESKQETFPESISQHLNGWIFGCDICQEVCPWNVKFAKETDEPAFQPRTININPDADRLLNLTEEAFRTHYRKSPIKRTKRIGLQRNIRYALNTER